MRFRIISGTGHSIPLQGGVEAEPFTWPLHIYKKPYPPSIIDEWRTDKQGPWLGRGFGHVETADRLTCYEQDMGYFVNLPLVEDILAFRTMVDCDIIIGPDGHRGEGWLITLYDGYVE